MDCCDALQDMVRGITPQEVAKFETLFTLFDEDGDGSLGVSEFMDLAPRIGMCLTEEELRLLFDDLDTDGSGDLDFQEFLALMAKHREANQLSLLRSPSDRDNFRHLQKLNAPRPGPLGIRLGHWAFAAWEISVLLGTLFYAVVAPLESTLDGPAVHPVAKAGTALLLACDVWRRWYELRLGRGEPGYLRSWGFLADGLAALPTDIACFWAEQGTTGRWLQYLRLLKLLRVGSLFTVQDTNLMTLATAQFHYGVMPMLLVLFWAVISAHILTVVWIVISTEAETAYIDAAYFVMYTLTTTGYGDIPVDTRNQKAFAIFLFCCGTVVSGWVVGKLVMLSQQADLVANTQRTMLETCAVMCHLQIPTDFAQEILAYQNHRLRFSHAVFNDAMSRLPSMMQDRMGLYARMKIVREVPFFADAPDMCLAKLAMALVNMVVPPEEYVVIAGEDGQEMFFLFHGMCDVLLPNGLWVAAIRQGGVFGEFALLEATRRSASVKSITYCQLFRLDASNFACIQAQFPELEKAIREEAARKQPKKPPPPPAEDGGGGGGEKEDAEARGRARDWASRGTLSTVSETTDVGASSFLVPRRSLATVEGSGNAEGSVAAADGIGGLLHASSGVCSPETAGDIHLPPPPLPAPPPRPASASANAKRSLSAAPTGDARRESLLDLDQDRQRYMQTLLTTYQPRPSLSPTHADRSQRRQRRRSSARGRLAADQQRRTSHSPSCSPTESSVREKRSLADRRPTAAANAAIAGLRERTGSVSSRLSLSMSLSRGPAKPTARYSLFAPAPPPRFPSAAAVSKLAVPHMHSQHHAGRRRRSGGGAADCRQGAAADSPRREAVSLAIQTCHAALVGELRPLLHPLQALPSQLADVAAAVTQLTATAADVKQAQQQLQQQLQEQYLLATSCEHSASPNRTRGSFRLSVAPPAGAGETHSPDSRRPSHKEKEGGEGDANGDSPRAAALRGRFRKPSMVSNQSGTTGQAPTANGGLTPKGALPQGARSMRGDNMVLLLAGRKGAEKAGDG